MTWLKLHWWKISGSALLILALLIGLKTPLAPGIESYSPDFSNAGDTLQMQVITVNAHFKSKPDSLSVYLISDSSIINGKIQNIQTENSFDASFEIDSSVVKKGFTHRNFDLLINSVYDGNIILKNAVDIKTDTSNKSTTHFISSPLVIAHSQTSYFSFPLREILYESIRNLFYHVPMWFGMTILLCVSMFFSFKYLRTQKLDDDLKAASFARIALLFGLLGIVTGMQWAKVTWGSWWNNDPKQNAAAIGLLIYLAYFVLRNSMDDPEKKARISAVFNVFALCIFIPIIYIVPRLTESLHPGNGGNPGFNQYDLDGNLRLVFYPAIIGWTLLGLWMAQLNYRIEKIKLQLLLGKNNQL